MVFYTVLAISFFLIALIIRLKRSVFYALAEGSVSLVNELIADVDDDTKIRQVQRSTNRLVVSLFKLLLLFAIAFAVGSIPVAIYCFVTKIPFSSLVFHSFYSILSISVGATIPFLIPIGKKNESGYSELSQLLHRMALDNYSIACKLFKRETKKIKRKNLERRKDFVIISGLARAGTTSLMNDLSRFEVFVSLSYANMPFLMCPNIWAKFYKPKNTDLKERSHKDGILIGLNSNEALEEYFFKVKADDSYIHDQYLSEYTISAEDYADYLDYQSIIKLDNTKIYLAKNNNFLLRYKSLRTLNADFLMVILYRDPLSHAASLLEKHLEYKKLQQRDPFVLEYMNWLGHHEFGENQKPFVFLNSEVLKDNDRTCLDYWLKIWINYYRYVLTIKDPRTLLINYDAYCKDPRRIIEVLLAKNGITSEVPDLKPFINARKTQAVYSQEIYDSAQEIYEQLNGREDSVR